MIDKEKLLNFLLEQMEDPEVIGSLSANERFGYLFAIEMLIRSIERGRFDAEEDGE